MCGAKTRSGAPCKKPAGFATSHPGFGRCNNHGGATPNGTIHAARLEAQHVAASIASEHDLEPHEALLWCVRLAAGELAFCAGKVLALEENKLVVDEMRVRRHEGDASSFVERTSHSDLNIWIRAKQDATERLARYAKMAIDAGVAERAIRLAEMAGERLATAFDVLLRGVDAREHPNAPAAVRAALTVIEGGKVAA